MKRHIEKKTKNSILAVILCVMCFFVLPLIMMQFGGEIEGRFGMAEFLEFVFWPMAGMGISAFYAAAVKNKKNWMLLPACTIVSLAGVNILTEGISFWISLLCLIFEAVWYEVIDFWRKIGE